VELKDGAGIGHSEGQSETGFEDGGRKKIVDRPIKMLVMARDAGSMRDSRARFHSHIHRGINVSMKSPM
jgi:hypothetical protein